jgi:hypothetical protein
LMKQDRPESLDRRFPGCVGYDFSVRKKKRIAFQQVCIDSFKNVNRNLNENSIEYRCSLYWVVFAGSGRAAHPKGRTVK